MRFTSILTCALIFLTLAHTAWADKVWKSGSEKLTLKLSEDFKKSSYLPKGSIFSFHSEAKNVQLVLSSVPQAVVKNRKKPDKPEPPVSTKQFIKAFPVLSAESKLTVLGEPHKVPVDGSSAVFYEVVVGTAPKYQTVYAFVGRGKKPYTVILNYASPRNPDMLILMKRVLASVKHS